MCPGWTGDRSGQVLDQCEAVQARSHQPRDRQVLLLVYNFPGCSPPGTAPPASGRRCPKIALEVVDPRGPSCCAQKAGSGGDVTGLADQDVFSLVCELGRHSQRLALG